MNKTSALTALAIAALAMAAQAVPSGINYQGVLTDSQGQPVTGTRAMSIKLYDAATSGTPLYTEDLGTVSVTDGVFSFEFGTSGTSNAEQSDTVAITDGSASSFQKVLSAASVVAGSVSVTDGTYTWSQSGGSSNDDDFGVAYSTNLRRVTVTYFNGAPAAGRTITATYRTPASGISGALAGDTQPWAEITVDGVAQVPRQKILTVPFAFRAVASEASFLSEIARVRSELADLSSAVTQTSGVIYATIVDRVHSTGTTIGLRSSLGSASRYGGGELVGIDYGVSGESISQVVLSFPRQSSNHNGYIKLTYTDGTFGQTAWNGFPNNGVVAYDNPNPQKKVRYVNATQIAQGSNDGPFAQIAACKVYSSDRASLTFAANIEAKKLFVAPSLQQDALASTFVILTLQGGSTIAADWNQWVDLTGIKTVEKIAVGGVLSSPSDRDISQLRIISFK